MARRNLSRALSAAALVVLSGGGALLGTPVPAGAADQILVTISDAGFSQRQIKARVGDVVTFQLDSTSSRHHTVTLLIDNGQTEFDFESQPGNTWTLPPFKNPGRAMFYDRYNIRGPDRNAFFGTIEVDEAPEPDPTTTTSSSTTTTVTTAPPTTATTAPPTTTTTAPGTIRPQLVPDPPTTTTTMAPPPTSAPNGDATAPPPGNGSGNGNDKPKDKPKDRDKDKSKAAAAETPTTEAPADPNAIPPDSLFDPAVLTPAPVILPDSWGDLGDGEVAALDAAALAELLHPASATEADSDDGRLTLYAAGALALLLLGGAVWGWQHRSSRYIPA